MLDSVDERMREIATKLRGLFAGCGVISVSSNLTKVKWEFLGVRSCNITGNRIRGQKAELEALKGYHGDLSQETRSFIKNGKKFIRKIDILTDKLLAIEVKSGYTSLADFVKKQIDKDAELLMLGTVDKVGWQFYKSEITGIGGPSKPLLEYLKSKGIEVVIK